MPISDFLEDFSALDGSDGGLRLMSDVALEDQRLASFEQGYSAGWEDAIHAQAQDQTRITGILSRRLEDLSFTYHDALTQMLASVEPVFQSMINSVLPETMSQTFGQHIVQELFEMAQERAGQPVILEVPVGSSAALKAALGRDFPMPFKISEDPRLDAGQASLRVGSAEREVDSAHLLQSIRNAIESFLHQLDEESQHG